MVVFNLKTVAFFAATLVPATEAVALGSYNVDPNSVSVSGLSSGGFMAAQLGVAYSSIFKKGFGVFAGGPYDCARNQQYTMCMNNNNPSTTTPNANLKAWSGNKIDSTANLKTRRVFLEVGTSDTTVGPNPMNALKNQLSPYVDAANLNYITRSGQAHVFPTDFDATGNGQCGSSSSPYIANCGYDGAGAVLNWMYGTLNARSASDQGTFVSFDQTGTYGATGMATSGILYVPQGCKTGANVCKLHVALHGCLQTTTNIGTKYTTNTGYNRWADTNNIIILYPQGTPDYTARQAWGGLLPNPNGCWDWVGWYGNNADQKGGVQMAAIVAQVGRIVSGFGQPTTTQPPSGTTTTAPTSTAIPLAPLYGQCGGYGWTGPTQCAQGVCTAYSPLYAQCLMPL